ncbi:MAG: GntR family transcriptional regulator [Chloroflexia bacterium]|nr:GntR family transcriptional regulator [Chloroflexia bacterium]
MTDFSAVKQQPLSQTLLITLREAIIGGRLKPGQPLVQSRLATQFGVSRAPLREAMNRLEEEGFVKTVPYKGSVVAPLTHKNVEEIRSLRRMLEEFAGQLIIADLRPDQLAEIERVYRQMRSAADRGEVDAVDAEDLALHEKICDLSGHSLLIEIWNRYANQFRRVLTFTNRVNHDLDLIVAMHEPLIEAFRRRDRAALRDFYLNHATDLNAYLPADWQADGAWGGGSDGNGRAAPSLPALLSRESA